MKVEDMEQWKFEMKCPLGTLRLVSDGEALNRIWFPAKGRGREKHAKLPTRPDLPVFAAAEKQLGEYFAGKRLEFDLPMAPGGTVFQQSVWDELCRIPAGVTTTYAAIAVKVGNAKACRAVGTANGANPLPILVPCHRVIGSNGNLTGFGGGLEAKRWLLVHEGAELF
jgi:methylated-DNA-[protein]-cysteine S-methyltransferase